MKLKQIVIYDANIIIDLYKIGLLHIIQQEDVQVHTTSLVITELKNPNRAEVKRLMPSLIVHSYDLPEQYATILSLQKELERGKERFNLSLPDVSVLHLASELSVTLCTGDGNLRKVAIRRGVNVTGTIGIIRQLFNEHIIDKDAAIQALKLLNETNSRIAPHLIDETMEYLSSQPTQTIP